MAEKTTTEKPDNSGKKQDTRFKKGQSGNPKGRPPGSVSITTEIKKKLNEAPDGQKKTYLELLINRILKLGVVDGKEQMIKTIWAYVDGMPKEKTDITSGGEKIETSVPEVIVLAEALLKEKKTHDQG